MAEQMGASLEKLLVCGRELGYSGEALRRFVEDQQQLERDERAERRQAEVERREQKRRAEAEKQERLMRNLEIEIEKLKLESMIKEREIEIERLREGSDTASSASSGMRPSSAPKPKLPKFAEATDAMDSYLTRFEVFARSQQWPEEEWAIALSALLTGKALRIFATMPVSQQARYTELKQALLKGFDLTEEGFRRKFREARLQKGETYAQFGARVEHYLTKWLELSNTEPTFEDLKNLVIVEQLMASCGPELTIYLKERRLKTPEELLEAAEVYREARSQHRPRQQEGNSEREDELSHRGGGQGPPDNASGPRMANHSGLRQGTGQGTRENQRECFLCHKVGHLAKDCRTRPKHLAAMDAEPGPPTLLSGMVLRPDTLLVQEGMVHGRPVQVMRDTGCSCGVVRAALVENQDLTGNTRPCILIDGTRRNFPTARVTVHSPYFTGQLLAVVMENPLYDVIIGNVPGAREPGNPVPTAVETAAVLTRNQRANAAVKPLPVAAQRTGMEATATDIQEAQRKDPPLAGLHAVAEGEETKNAAQCGGREVAGERKIKRIIMSYGPGPPNIEGMVSLKVDNLTYRTTPEDLRRAFGKYGDVGDVYIPHDHVNRESRGFAFVRFFDRQEAEAAMDSMDGAILDGRELRCQMARYGRPVGPYRVMEGGGEVIGRSDHH